MPVDNLGVHFNGDGMHDKSKIDKQLKDDLWRFLYCCGRPGVNNERLKAVDDICHGPLPVAALERHSGRSC
jgi:hypothetical protein